MRSSLRRSLAAAFLGCAVVSTTLPLGATEESVTNSLNLATRYADLLRDSIALVEHDADGATLWAALDDARRAVAEVDRLTANAAILPATQHDRQRFAGMSAEAHLVLALFETHGMEFERAREEIALARTISDHVDAPDFRTPWVALPAGAPGRALVTRYNLLTLREFEAALGAFWNRVRMVPFEFHGFDTKELLRVNLVRSDRPPPGSLDDRLLARGAARMRHALGQGEPSFSISLPPGLYRFHGRPGSDLARSFIVPEVSPVDPVVIDRARFTLRVEPRPGPRGPRFFLNGLEVTNFASMPYGVFRVKVDNGLFPNAPRVVRFLPGEGIPDKTRTSWKVFVPAGGTSLFHIDKASLGRRSRR